MHIRHRFVFWIFVYLYCFLIFFYSSNPSPGTSLGTRHLVVAYSSYLHLLEYLILSFLVYLASYYTHLFRKYSILSTFLFVALFAISDEVHQLFVPGRYFSYIDMGVDTFSSVLFFAVRYVTKNYEPRKKSS